MSTVTGTYSMPHLKNAPAKDIHKALMAAITATSLDPTQPRADAKLLWARQGDNLIIRSRKDCAPEASSWLRVVRPATEEDVPTVPTRIRASVAALKTIAAPNHPSGGKRPRSKRIAVNKGEAAGWLDAFLERKGLIVQDTTILSYERQGRGNGGTVPLLTFEATFEPSHTLSEAWTHGLGREKNYGAGLIVPRAYLEH